MSTKDSKFSLVIQPASNDPKAGFKAVAGIGAGDFQELVLRYELGGKPFSFKQFESNGKSTTCAVREADLSPLVGKKPKFYAVATFANADKQESVRKEVDLS